MRRFKVLGLAIVAMLALTAATAGAASAKSGLAIKEPSGPPVAPGATAVAVIGVEGCNLYTEGTLTSNRKSSDKAAFSVDINNECTGSATISGSTSSLKIGLTGKMQFKTNKLEVTLPGPCVYAIKKYEVPFTVGGYTYGEGTTTGKLNKTASNPSCATSPGKTDTFSIEAALFNGEFGVFEAVEEEV